MSANTSFTHDRIRTLFTTVILSIGLAAAANAAPPAPSIIASAQSPITVEAGDYTLMGVSIAMVSGDYVPYHSHLGPDLILVFEGEVLNNKQGKETTVKAGEFWLDLPGERHAVTNSGDITARLWASALLPKGDTSLMPSAQFPLNVEAGEYTLVSHVLDFAPGAEMPAHVHGGRVVSYILAGEITLLENDVSKQLTTYQSWTEVPEVTYSVSNASGSTARVATSMLLPEGVDEITFVTSPTAPATEVVATPENIPTVETVPNSSTQFLPALIGAGLLLILLAVGYYLRHRTL
jgi:quercetin dioxygenase-like cupin family protein